MKPIPIKLINAAMACGLAIASPQHPLSSASLEERLPETLIDAKGRPVSRDTLAGRTIGVYFSASWCGPCVAFTPKLIEFARKHEKDFAVVLVGSDEDEEAMREYMTKAGMPFAAVFGDSEAGTALARLFNNSAIPQLGILGADGSLLKYDGRGDILFRPDEAIAFWRSGKGKPLTLFDTDNELWEPATKIQGRLDPNSRLLPHGRRVATHVHVAEPGARTRFTLRSDDFDAFLAIEKDGRLLWRHDDIEADEDLNARIEVPASPQPVEYRIHVTTANPDQMGAYEIIVERGPYTEDRLKVFEGNRSPQSELDPWSGEFYNVHVFQGNAGQRALFDVTSVDFKPMMLVGTPGGERFVAPEDNENSFQSRVAGVLPHDGEYSVQIIGGEKSDFGRYTLTLEIRPAVEESAAAEPTQ